MIVNNKASPDFNSKLFLEMEHIIKIYGLEINVDTKKLTFLINSFYKQNYSVEEVNYVIGSLYEKEFINYEERIMEAV